MVNGDAQRKAGQTRRAAGLAAVGVGCFCVFFFSGVDQKTWGHQTYRSIDNLLVDVKHANYIYIYILVIVRKSSNHGCNCNYHLGMETIIWAWFISSIYDDCGMVDH